MNANDSKAVEQKDQSIIGRDKPCIDCGQNIGYMNKRCPECWEEHQDALNDEETNEDQAKRSPEVQIEDLVGRDKPCIDCGQNIGYMDKRCPECWEEHQDALNDALEANAENQA